MNGRGWLKTLGELGGSVWENATLPTNYWNKDKGYDNANIHIPPTFAGVGDGVIGEISDYPQLIKLGYDVSTKKEFREGLWNSVKNITIESIKNASIDFYEQKKANYSSSKSYIVNHTVGQDGVQLASILIGAGGIKKIATNLDDGADKVAKELAEKGGELVGKYNWGTAKRYFQHIQDVTGRPVSQKQIDKLKDALRAKEYKKLSETEIAAHRSDFNKRKNKIIDDWEVETGQSWPTYTEPVYSANGTPIRKIGDKYDAHHIIENKFGGDNEWWNMHPAKFPDEHQGGIHGAGSPSRELFK